MILHMAALGSCGETGLKLGGFVKWLDFKKLSNEQKNSVSEISWQDQIEAEFCFQSSESLLIHKVVFLQLEVLLQLEFSVG